MLSGRRVLRAQARLGRSKKPVALSIGFAPKGYSPGKKEEKISAEEHVAAQESSVLKLREDSPKSGSSRSLLYSLSPSLQTPCILLWQSQLSQQGQPLLIL